MEEEREIEKQFSFISRDSGHTVVPNVKVGYLQAEVLSS